MKKSILIGMILMGGFGCRSDSVDFVSPKDGATVSKSFELEFAVNGFKVKPAGQLEEGTGHHHLIVNGDPVSKGVTVPADDNHIHYGKGQTKTSLTLPPGKHTLTLQFADGLHQSYGPSMSKTISVTVE